MDKVFSRRVFIVLAFKVILLFVLLARIFNLGVWHYSKMRLLSRKNFLKTYVLLPPRGKIIDVNHVPIAHNTSGYDLLVYDSYGRDDILNTVKQLNRLITIDPQRVKDVINSSRKKRILKDRLTPTELAIVESRLFDIKGVYVVRDYARTYPFAQAFAHTVGYVGINEVPGAELPDSLVGKTGIEKVKNQTLLGTPGNQLYEINAFGDKISFVDHTPAQPGEDVRLNIDYQLQQYAYSLLSKHRAGSIIVMDVLDGSIKAMCSYPSYDPNLLTYYRFKNTEWAQNAYEKIEKPLLNRACKGLYAPGSLFKILLAAIASEKNITPQVMCNGVYEYNAKYRYHCWKVHGKIHNIEDALKHSCDIYFYHLARAIGIDTIAEYARRIGLVGITGIEIEQEIGLVPDTAWKKAKNGKSWLPGETLLTGIGQGYLSLTPIEMLVGFSNLISSAYITPRLLADSPVSVIKNTIFDPESILTVMHGMHKVVNARYGTGWRAASRVIEISGKTGTSQVRTISKWERSFGVLKNIELPWDQRDHALFFSFFPSYEPRFSAITIIDHGGSGGRFAAPIGGKILRKAHDIMMV